MKKVLYTLIAGALLMASCTKDSMAELGLPADNTIFKVEQFPVFDDATRAVGTADEGKRAWEEGDKLLITTDIGTSTTLSRSADGVWTPLGDANISTAGVITVTYAPNCELVEGAITPKEGLALGTGEYFSTVATYADGVVTISFASVERNYSRLRLATAAGKEVEAVVTKFTPAGGVEQSEATYTLTADSKGNAYLYGLFGNGATISVVNGSTATERTLENGTLAGKSYALHSNSEFLLPIGADFNTALKSNLGECTKFKFVVSSTATSDKTLTATDGEIGYFITNGDTLELHTSCDKFRGNANSSRMFRNCSNLTSIDISGFDTSSATNISYMFDSCQKLASLDLSNFDTSNVIYMSSVFKDCRALTSLDLSSFDTQKVEGMDYMFYGCTELASLDVSNFDTSAVTTMIQMFYDCKSLTSLDVSKFNTSKVEVMSDMFYGCENLTSLDLTNFDTSNVEAIASMFQGCSKLTSLDLSSFDTSKVTSMDRMFINCHNLTSLNVSSFNTSKVKKISYMFNGCYSLPELDLTNFDFSAVTECNFTFHDFAKNVTNKPATILLSQAGYDFLSTKFESDDYEFKVQAAE